MFFIAVGLQIHLQHDALKCGGNILTMEDEGYGVTLPQNRNVNKLPSVHFSTHTLNKGASL